MTDNIPTQARLDGMVTVAFQMADRLATMTAIVHWCVENSGETLDDHPLVLARAREALRAAREAYSQQRLP